MTAIPGHEHGSFERAVELIKERITFVNSIAVENPSTVSARDTVLNVLYSVVHTLEKAIEKQIHEEEGRG